MDTIIYMRVYNFIQAHPRLHKPVVFVNDVSPNYDATVLRTYAGISYNA